MSQPFERLQERLLSAGIAPRHVRRYIAELSEHAEDLRAEEERAGRNSAIARANALTRLGAVDTLAKAMTAQPSLRSWADRAPWAAFVLAPGLAFVATLALTILAMIAEVHVYRPSLDAPPALPGWFAPTWLSIVDLERLILPLALGWAIAALAIRRRTSPLWPVIGLAAIAVVGATFQLDIQFPSGPGTHGEIGLRVDHHLTGLYRSVANLALLLGPYAVWRLVKGSAAERSALG